jgi:membrane associated rhomboid family serine protease
MFFPIPTSIRGARAGLVPPAGNSMLIALNVLLFVLGFSIRWGVAAGSSPVTVVTHAFIHADVFHLLGNMWMLWVFGNAVNRRLGNGLYVGCYLGVAVAVGLCAWILSHGLLVGSSGAIYGVIGIGMLLLPAARVTVYYIALLPATLVIGVFRRPQHWLGWLVRWDHFECRMLWAAAVVPLIEIWGLWSWFRVGQLNWTHLAHLLGFVFGALIVLALPKRVSMNPAFAG